MSAPLLEVVDAVVEFSTPGGTMRALDGVSLTVSEGETVAVVGESGCGKTTLARVVLGLQKMVSGKVVFQGEETTGVRRSRTHSINDVNSSRRGSSRDTSSGSMLIHSIGDSPSGMSPGFL